MTTVLRVSAFVICILAVTAQQEVRAKIAQSNLRFEISFPSSVHQQAITGRMFLMISRKADPEVRLQVGSYNSAPLFGLDVEELNPGEVAVVDESIAGYPLRSLRDIPAGDYYVQALLNVYTQFHRADGHVIWAHMDQWEGQQFNISPGNLYSKMQRVHVDPSQPGTFKLSLTEVIPPVTVPADTPWVKRVKIQSKLLTRFWGRPIYLGAVVLLPHDYAANPDTRYPVVYQQGHFSLSAPFDFTTEKTEESEEKRRWRENLGFETGYEFYRTWSSEHFPRMIAVTLQHPTPYYDDSFAVNSANAGPYGDAITTELIPYIEQKFRAIGKPYARVLTGGSQGGFESLALQLYHPDLFGGAWIFCPSEIDFRRYYSINAYEDKNAFMFEPQDNVGKSFYQEWLPVERVIFHTDEGQPSVTVRQLRQLESVLGSRGRGAIWFDPSEATYGPVGTDGYPQHFFDAATGEINRNIVNYWRDHGYDLRNYAQKNWSTIGSQLVGKLHFYVGEMDEYYVNLGVYLFEEFLEKTKKPYYGGSFDYGRPTKGHMWTPMTNAAMVRVMAEQISKNAPAAKSKDN